MPNGLARWGLIVVAVALVAFLLAVAPWRESTRRLPPPVDQPPAVASRESPVAAPTAPPAPIPEPPPPGAAGEPDASDPLGPLDDESGRRWATVDMDAVRAAMPNNLYWTMSVPTKDPAVLQAREQERARWNDAYGKVLSNTATEQEVRAFYAHRERLSLDYVEFANYLLAHYAQELPERDVGMLKLAIRLHLARLEEIPRKIAEALERSAAHAEARRAWQDQQAAFDKSAPVIR